MNLWYIDLILRFSNKEELDNYINGVKFTHHNFKGKF